MFSNICIQSISVDWMQMFEQWIGDKICRFLTNVRKQISSDHKLVVHKWFCLENVPNINIFLLLRITGFYCITPKELHLQYPHNPPGGCSYCRVTRYCTFIWNLFFLLTKWNSVPYSDLVHEHMSPNNVFSLTLSVHSYWNSEMKFGNKIANLQ